MAYGTPADPVAGTVITVAYAVTNILDPIRWLRQLTGGTDPPGSDYIIRSTSTTVGVWSKVTQDTIADGAVSDAKLAIQKVNRAGDVMTGDLTVSRAGAGQPGQGVLYLGQTGGLRYLYWNGSNFELSGGPLTVGAGMTVQGDIVAYRPGATGGGVIYLGLTGSLAYLQFDGSNYQLGGGPGGTAQIFRAGQRVWDAGNDGAGSGLDADLLDGMHASEIIAAGAGGGVPSGVIAMWLTSMTPPTGWVAETSMYNLMPGGVNAAQNGTFGTLASGGGAASHSHDLSNHAHDYNHSHTVNAHAHTADHAHLASSGNNSASGESGGTGTNRADHPHTHPITVSSTSGLSTSNVGGGTANLGTSPVNTGAPNTNATNVVSNLPPYKAVLYIRKS